LIFAFFSLGQQSNEVLNSQQIDLMIRELKKDIEKNHYSFTVGDNPALKYSIDQLCGFKVQPNWQAKAKQHSIQAISPKALELETERDLTALPAKWDWREHNGVTNVRDQGSCGSCWAFATLGAFESLLMIKQDINTDLSEQWLISCNTLGYGCNGGWWIHNMLVDPGAALEEDFKYAARDLPCREPERHPYKLTGYAYVDGNDNIPVVSRIKEAIYNYGPVSVAVYVGHSFQSYTGGVFDKDEATSTPLFGCGKPVTAEPNHGVVLVGWDDSKQAWILRNSWSSGWGENGYMYIRYNINLVGYAAIISF
jgi:C1A family cysteine protease